jgi:hypothetical protein
MPIYKQNNSLPAWIKDFFANGIPEGKRDNTILRIASWFRDYNFPIDEAKAQILPCGLKSGFTEAQTFKPIDSAYARLARARHSKPAAAAKPKTTPSPSKPAPAPAPRVVKLPDPIQEGFAKLLNAAFEPDEYVALSAAEPDGAGNLAPKAGQVLKRERWLDHYANGRLAKMFPDKTGVFVRINPMKPGGKTDSEVAAFRHCLVEFDLDENGNLIPLQTQFEIFVQSGLPITAVLSSGHK